MRYGKQRRSSNVEDRRGQSAAGIGMAAAIPMLLLRLLFSRLGRRFLLPVLVIGVGAYLFIPGFQQMINASMFGASGGGYSDPATSEPYEGAPEEERLADFTAAVLGSTEDVWTAVFRESGAAYRQPSLVLYTNATNTNCGFGSAQMGPFYCPPDESVYIDLAFLQNMGRELGASGDFAQAYVIAHEVGHHVQNLIGVFEWSQREQRRARSEAAANQVQVRVELMADCLAGVWAARSQQLSQVQLERGDLREAMRAAASVGDDTLQRNATGRVMPDGFTHGTSEQRARWFTNGFEGQSISQCDTREVAYNRL